MRSNISSSSQVCITHRHTKISTRVICCCQPTSCARHHYSPLPRPGTSRSRSSGGECRLTHSRTRVDGKPAKAVGCRESIEASSQNPSHSIWPSHGEELTVVILVYHYSPHSMKSPRPVLPPEAAHCSRYLRTRFRRNVNLRSFPPS